MAINFIRFEAPLDAFVESLTGGGRVDQGQQLFKLRSPQIDFHFARSADPLRT
jgi:hypothetical protein